MKKCEDLTEQLSSALSSVRFFRTLSPTSEHKTTLLKKTPFHSNEEVKSTNEKKPFKFLVTEYENKINPK